MKALKPQKLLEVQLRILDTLAEVCRSKNLTFFLYYGTLIGAMRHKGMIPWDDDIDIAMPRQSFEELQMIDWTPHDLKIVSPGTCPASPYAFIKLCDVNTIAVENIDSQLDGLGVNIDIFPIDHVETQSIRSRAAFAGFRLLKQIQIFKVVKLSRARSFTRNAFLALGKAICLPLSTNTVVRLESSLAKRIGKQPRDEVASLLGPYGKREVMQAVWLESDVGVEFEGRTLPAPCGYDEILRKLYGNYM